MKRVPLICALATLFFGITPVTAQVVQLPTGRNFGYTGSVIVPDGGTAYLGGNGAMYATSTARGFGPFSSVAVGHSVGAAGLSVSVQIIDLAALDQAILNTNVAMPPDDTTVSALSPAADGSRNFISSATEGSGDTATRVGMDPGRWQRMLAAPVNIESKPESQVAEDIRYYLALGKEAERLNRIHAARVYYKMAIDAMTPAMLARYEEKRLDLQATREQAAKDAAKRNANIQRSNF
ncbi:MAG: hypothetical protein KDB03_14105 [Planctomycetales bacterium]|nr:hypothetical protein [Planctomycetales bacterium]